MLKASYIEFGAILLSKNQGMPINWIISVSYDKYRVQEVQYINQYPLINLVSIDCQNVTFTKTMKNNNPDKREIKLFNKYYAER